LKARDDRRKAAGTKGEGERAAPSSPLALSASAASRRRGARAGAGANSSPTGGPPAGGPPAGAGARGTTTVGVVGAGRLGTALARALAGVGYRVEFMLARDVRHARRAARLAGVGAQALPASRLGELPRTDLLLVTTPDDAVAETASRLAAAEDERRAKAGGGSRAKAGGRRQGGGPVELSGGGRGVVLHTSGALSSEVLAPLRARGYAVGSLHPLAAVSDAGPGAESLRRAYFCIEGDARAVRLGRRLVRDLGARSFSVPTGQKALYHAAAVMCAGHAVALFDAAAGLLAACGLGEREARRVLLPLLQSTLDNLARQEPARALTGTFARADVETARKHLAALEESGDAAALEIYRLLGRRSLPLAAAKGTDAAALEAIARALED